MSIIFNKDNQEFHLYNDKISYIINVLPDKSIGQLYYGKKIHHRDSFSDLLELEAHAFAPCPFKDRHDFSKEHVKQEYPVYGLGDYRSPAMLIKKQSGDYITEFKFMDYDIFAGKRKLENLPATYVESDFEAETLEINMYDDIIGCSMMLSYTIYADMPVITRSVKFSNDGEEPFSLERVMSMSLDLPSDNYNMLTLNGAWARERNITTQKLSSGTHSIQSLRGSSSHNANPFLALLDPSATETDGEVYGFSFVYSGNFLASTEVDNFGTSRIQMGINPLGFTWELSPDEEFTTPEAVMVYSSEGLGDMSRTFHKLFNTRLARGKWRESERPILINNWEATYFDFDEKKILEIAKSAADIGIELFVLDDGWFSTRNGDTSGLGDWYVNKEKLPHGIDGLSKKVNKLGMKFGFWIEPEMVNEDSNLFRDHPDWVLGSSDKELCQWRNQYVLDFSKDEVVEYIFDMLKKTIDKAEISYIKWDMNRNITDVFSRGTMAKDQGKVLHKYILGVYRLYEMLISSFPNILFESCSGGGGRFDPGMLYYAPQAWTSDDTDAIERLKIQYGTSVVYPISSMGAHVSAVPNHQLVRTTSIDTRANVAFFGAFGYELNIGALSDSDKDKVKEQISFYKKYRNLFQYGSFYRLKNSMNGNVTAWMVVSPDKAQAIVGYYKVLNDVNTGYEKIKLCGLDENQKYTVALNGEICYNDGVYGDELMNLGLIIKKEQLDHEGSKAGESGDFSSRLYILS